MPRKKKSTTEITQFEAEKAATSAPVIDDAHAATETTTAVAELPQTDTRQPEKIPDWIDGPPVDENGNPIAEEAVPKAWANPYKAIFTNSMFEMGEDRRFKQRVFKFKEKPADEILATLKENGFTYRPSEHAWTIPASPDTRRLSEDLTLQFAGSSQGKSR